MRYSVRLDNIPETDQLIFKLIFSLSEKTKGRMLSYFVTDQASSSEADIQITGGSDNQANPEASPLTNIWFNPGESVTGDLRYIINKPLIATRVLKILDQYVENQCKNESNENSDLLDSQITTSQEVEASKSELEIEFSISEEEASELAIVEDESLSNPNNEPIVTISSANESLLAQRSNLVMLHPGVEEASGDVVAESSEDQPIKGKPRALVVDDSPSVRKQVELELELFNVEVDFAENKAEAMNLAEQNHYDVAFLDVMLPDGDGFQICKSFKHDIQDIKVIMLTGKASPADKIKGTMVGCDAYLVKPVGRMTFQNVVCRYLQLREQFAAIHA